MRRIMLMAATVFGLLVIANTSFADRYGSYHSPYHSHARKSYHRRAYLPSYGCQTYGYGRRHAGYGGYDYISPRVHHRRYAHPYGYGPSYGYGGGVSVHSPRLSVGVRW